MTARSSYWRREKALRSHMRKLVRPPARKVLETRKRRVVEKSEERLRNQRNKQIKKRATYATRMSSLSVGSVARRKAFEKRILSWVSERDSM